MTEHRDEQAEGDSPSPPREAAGGRDGRDGQPGQPAKAPAAWPWMLVAALAYWVGQLIGIPGVDHQTLAQYMAQSEPLGLGGVFDGAVTALPILGASLSTLVLVHVVLIVAGLAERVTARRIAAAAYLALSAMQAFALVLWLESLSGMGLFYDLIADPGWGFRVKAVLALTAGAAVLWWLAGRIDATRRLHGALFLLLVATATELVPEMTAVGAQIGLGEMTPVSALGYLAVPIAWTIAGAAVALRPPAAWPVPVVLRLELRSAWDALGLVLLGALPGQALTAAVVMARPEAASDWLVVLEQWAVVIVAVFFAAWWWRRGRPVEGPAKRPLWAVAVPALLLLGSVGLIAAGLVASGGVERMTAPGPLEGEQRFEIVLEADGRFAPTDADAMVSRLESLGAYAEVLERSERRITLGVIANELPPVLDALAPRQLGLHLVGPPLDPELSPPPGITREAIAYIDPPREVLDGPCEAVRAYRETLPSDSCLWAVEEIRPDLLEVEAGEPSCQLSCFDPTPILTSAHVAEAEVRVDSQLGQPVVWAELTEEGERRMREATRANLRRPLGIIFDAEAVSVPVIQSEIGGQLQITLGAGAHDELQREAHAIALALQPGGHISTPWTFAELR